jgi:hypothetical protein
MKIALGDGWLEKIETLHQNRKGVWKVDVEVDPTAAKVYRLFSKENDEPFCSSAITVSKNQVHTFSIFGEDAAPLLKEIIKDYPPIFLPRYRNYRYTYCFPTHYAQTIQFKELPEVIKLQDSETQRIKVDKETFRNGTLQAGNTSGIIETIEAMKCLEVLLA